MYWEGYGIYAAYYKNTERRTAIYTNYDRVVTHSAYIKKKALCVELETEKGRLSVYGTSFGIHGNRCCTFMEDMKKQMDDLRRITSAGKTPFAFAETITVASRIITISHIRDATRCFPPLPKTDSIFLPLISMSV